MNWRMGTILLLWVALSQIHNAGFGQHEPFKVHDTVPVILDGPYLVAPTETGITVVWRTDTPCHSKVMYGIDGELSLTAEPDEHGLVPVGTLHTIRLTGLSPGKTYQYKIISTRVVRMKAYWPEKGKSRESPIYRFQLPDRRKNQVSFSFVTDSQHEDVRRLQANLDLVDWDKTEFLVHGGDSVDAVDSEDQFFRVFLGPISEALAHTKPLVFARGNHDMRGAFARQVYQYVPTENGKFYYAFDAGPIHFLVLDTGEDKDDATNVYARLNSMKTYRERELDWFRNHVQKSERLRQAPFRVLLVHSPSWGWVSDENDQWTAVANQAKTDLMIAGHRHRFSVTEPGERGNDYTILVVDQDQVATVEATGQELKVTITGSDGSVVDILTLPTRTNPE